MEIFDLHPVARHHAAGDLQVSSPRQGCSLFIRSALELSHKVLPCDHNRKESKGKRRETRLFILFDYEHMATGGVVS